jgi:hypothetical protein
MRDSTKKGPFGVMLAGFFGAIICNLAVYSWIFGRDWEWAEGMPLGLLGTGMNYMATFFHEIGHTVFAWFYGYPTLPSFDFEHGGGMAWMMSDQQKALVFCVWAIIGYGIYLMREYILLQILLGLLLLFGIATAFSEDWRLSVINFMGPGFEPLTGALLLYRALMNLVERQPGERFASAMFGFGLILRAWLDGWGLLHSGAHRTEYYKQKGQHGFGDFDKIGDTFPHLGFHGAVVTWLALGVVSFLAAFILYAVSGRSDVDG